MPKVIVFATSALSLVFVLLLGSQMPERVASHFNFAGVPDAYLARDSFVALFAVICGSVPAFLWWLQVQAAKRGYANLPHPSYWFSPQERTRTLGFLSRHAAWFSCLLAVFLCYTFWLVVRANSATSDPVPLSMHAFIAGLLVFLVLTAAWLYLLQARFRREDA